MKLLFVSVCLLCFSFKAFCQTDPEETTIEDLKREILLMKEESKEMQLHLYKSHKEFKAGTILYAIGLGLTVAGSITAANNNNDGGGILLIGTGCILVGGILHLDSHKHIGRAGSFRLRRR